MWPQVGGDTELDPGKALPGLPRPKLRVKKVAEGGWVSTAWTQEHEIWIQPLVGL